MKAKAIKTFDNLLARFRQNKILLFWLGANVVLPIILLILLHIFFYFIELPIEAAILPAFSAAFIILLANVFAIFKYKNHQKLFFITAILNLLGFVFFGSISFVTSIPNIPFVVESYYM